MKKILLYLTLLLFLTKTYGQCDYDVSSSLPSTLVLNDGDTLCVGSDLTTTATIVINSGGIISISNNSDLKINGSLTVQPGGRIEFLDCNSTLEVYGNYTGPYNECELVVYCAPASAQDPLTLVSGSKTWNDWCAHGPLPVELIDFSVKESDSEILVSWVTASEINNHYFEVQTSSDGINWEIMDIVEGMGNTMEITSYSSLVSTENTYFRLRQVDFDGQFEYSNILYIKNTNKDSLTKIIPNPNDGDFIIKLNSVIKEEMVIRIFDIKGSLVCHQITINDLNSDILILNIKDKLSPGVYQISGISDEVIFSEKLIVK
tara:strand:+ start:8714 stop:9667 length:954 start_codon:yes stop_codon:yes gene_type:complete